MAGNRSSISKAQSYGKIGEFWDAHDLTEFARHLHPAKFEVAIESEKTYYPVDAALSASLHSVARSRGISPDVLLNLWVQEKISESHK